MSNKRTVTVRFSALINVPLELRVAVPMDEDGEPDMEGWEIVRARQLPIDSTNRQEVTEAIANNPGEIDEFEAVIREALAKGED